MIVLSTSPRNPVVYHVHIFSPLSTGEVQRFGAVSKNRNAKSVSSAWGGAVNLAVQEKACGASWSGELSFPIVQEKKIETCFQDVKSMFPPYFPGFPTFLSIWGLLQQVFADK